MSEPLPAFELCTRIIFRSTPPTPHNHTRNFYYKETTIATIQTSKLKALT